VLINLHSVTGLLIAALGGFSVGLEREWSGHAAGRQSQFAGVRTFTLLGAVSGLSGWLWYSGLQAPSIVLLAGASALIVSAYVRASRRDIDATTEVAALVVVAAGFCAAIGEWAIAGGVIAITTLLLVEKSRLHKIAYNLDDTALRAAVRFGVMAIVILPLLPEGAVRTVGRDSSENVVARGAAVFRAEFSGLSGAAHGSKRFRICGGGNDRRCHFVDCGFV
jgi:hypothetical protein